MGSIGIDNTVAFVSGGDIPAFSDHAQLRTYIAQVLGISGSNIIDIEAIKSTMNGEELNEIEYAVTICGDCRNLPMPPQRRLL
ncbi:MAG: hypothetical protein JXC85_06185 [Candidatus Aenigmarchaeota archaeon]|nr:hypothetical protein [Candidatus Aenigmarchaeota archaeon]